MTTIGQIQRVITAYRRRLLANEYQATIEIERAYQSMLTTIQPHLDKLYQEMTDKIATGGQLALSWLYEAQRLGVIVDLITGHVDAFGILAMAIVGRLQERGWKLGIGAAIAMLDVSIPLGVSWSFGEPSQKAIAALVGASQNGSPLASLFAGFGREAAQKMRGALITGLTLGQSPGVVAREVRQALEIPRQRAMTIARNEMQRSYRSAALATYQENDDVVEGWIWMAAIGARRPPCPACIAKHGTKHKLSEDLNDHVCGRCARAPYTKDWSDILGPLGIDTSSLPDTRVQLQSGPSWFEQQDEATQRKILGGSKYEAWKDGSFEFADIVGQKDDSQWGSSVYEKPLKELVRTHVRK
jgi:hypothetical protein